MGDLLPHESLSAPLTVGQRVTYLRRDRGGYGLLVKCPATVVKVHDSGRVTVRLNDGRLVTVFRQSIGATGESEKGDG